jgi:hypothetical protein
MNLLAGTGVAQILQDFVLFILEKVSSPASNTRKQRPVQSFAAVLARLSTCHILPPSLSLPLPMCFAGSRSNANSRQASACHGSCFSFYIVKEIQ